MEIMLNKMVTYIIVEHGYKNNSMRRKVILDGKQLLLETRLQQCNFFVFENKKKRR